MARLQRICHISKDTLMISELTKTILKLFIYRYLNRYHYKDHIMTMISEDTIDSFILELHTYCQQHPSCFVNDDEGYEQFHQFVHSRFDKFWSFLIKERNYN